MTICLDCATVTELRAIRTATDYLAYLSDSGHSVTTWTGAKLGTVTSCKTRRLPLDILRPRLPVLRARVTDVHGGHWHGSGPAENGTYVRLHRNKNS